MDDVRARRNQNALRATLPSELKSERERERAVRALEQLAAEVLAGHAAAKDTTP